MALDPFADPFASPADQALSGDQLAGDVVPGSPSWGTAPRPTPEDRVRALEQMLRLPFGKAPVLPITPPTPGKESLAGMTQLAGDIPEGPIATRTRGILRPETGPGALPSAELEPSAAHGLLTGGGMIGQRLPS